jgi:hypothetical protein
MMERGAQCRAEALVHSGRADWQQHGPRAATRVTGFTNGLNSSLNNLKEWLS